MAIQAANFCGSSVCILPHTYGNPVLYWKCS